MEPLDIHVSVLKGGMEKYAMRNPLCIPSPQPPEYERHIIFEGISVDKANKQH